MSQYDEREICGTANVECSFSGDSTSVSIPGISLPGMAAIAGLLAASLVGVAEMVPFSTQIEYGGSLSMAGVGQFQPDVDDAQSVASLAGAFRSAFEPTSPSEEADIHFSF
jgi:hypothetical protein